MDEDQQAIADCQKGRTDSYRILVDKYKTRAYYAALMYTGNQDDALDLSQEAFYRAFRAIKSFELGKNFYTWLYQILRNLCINHYKRIRRRSVVFSDIDEQHNPALLQSNIKEPDQIFEETERRDKLWAALLKLKSADREILILKEFDELSYQEIAEVFEIPIGSVMSRLYYARQKLAGLLMDLK
jgi:RNA polymerase sigma-70 factor (ECF subfamily)